MVPLKSGFIPIIGRPNVGKSTFLNRLLSAKVSIVTHKPQTTRDRISGIYNDKRGQIIFIDSPGIHDSKTPLNKKMVKEAFAAIDDCEFLIHMTDRNLFRFPHEEELILEELGRKEKKAILVINKIDRMTLDERERIVSWLSERHTFEETFDTDSLGGYGLEEVVEYIFSALPEGPRYFPEDYLSDRPMKFHCKEIIREKLILQLKEEIPYSIAVIVEEMKEREEKGIVMIRALIYVERESQKGIVIGKGGSVLKKIGSEARREMEEVLGKKVFLELRVKLEKGWTRKEWLLKKMGY
jgi:GTP-binding protein Era